MGEVLHRNPEASESDAERLVRASLDLSAARDPAQVMQVVKRAARDLTGADGVTFVLREGPLVHYADEEAISPLWKGKRFPIDSCISGWAMTHRCSVVIEDVYADERIPHGAYRPTFVKSLAMVPVRPEDPVAAIGLYWARCRRATDREVRLVESLAGLTSVALANAALYAELRQALAARDEFLSVAAHELRTPITPIALQLGWALRSLDRGDAATARSAVERVLANVRRTTQVVDELLDVSRVVQERVVLDRQPMDLAAVARDVVERFRAAERSRIALHVPEPVPGRWDRLRIEHVLENLLANALKFGADGPVEVAVGRSGGIARVAVSDHGIGIAPEDQARIVERFARAVTMRHFGGLGLGLWLVRQLVEAHGGTVEVSSSPGRGSTFSVLLPGADAAPTHASAPLSVAHGS